MQVTIDGQRLAVALAERLRRIAPADVTIEVWEGRVDIQLGDAGYGTASYTALLVADARDAPSAISHAAYDALDTLQDYICEYTTELWPAVDRVNGKREAANPGVEVSGDRVRMWFGDREQPLIVVEDLIVSDYCLSDP